MTVYLVISLPKKRIPVHRVYIVLANPTYVYVLASKITFNALLFMAMSRDV